MTLRTIFEDETSEHNDPEINQNPPVENTFHQLRVENFKFTNKENQLLMQALNKETPVISDTSNFPIEETSDVDDLYKPVDISTALLELRGTKRYVMKIINLAKSTEFKKIRDLLRNARGVWGYVVNDYSYKVDLSTITFVPKPKICSSFSLAEYIITNININSDNIYIYEISKDNIISPEYISINTFNIEWLSYASVKNRVNLSEYSELIINFNEDSNALNKDMFNNAMRSVLLKDGDLKYSSWLIGGNITGDHDDIPNSLNNYFSLKMISDYALGVSERYGINISITLKPFDRSLQAIPEQETNMSRLAKKQRINEDPNFASTPQPTSNKNSIHEGLNIFFQNNKSPSSLRVDELIKRFTNR